MHFYAIYANLCTFYEFQKEGLLIFKKKIVRNTCDHGLLNVLREKCYLLLKQHWQPRNNARKSTISAPARLSHCTTAADRVRDSSMS